LEFFGRDRLLSASNDGKICVWSTEDWEPQMKLDAHKNGVISVAVHPSGKLLLSFGYDKWMKCWNFSTGKLAYKKSLKFFGSFGRPNKIFWVDGGRYFSFVFNHSIEIFETETCAKFFSVEIEKSKISAAESRKNSIFLGLDDGQMKKIELNSKRCISLNAGHPVRVKAIQLVDDYMFTADSSGLIKAWKCSSNQSSAEDSTENFDEVANVTADGKNYMHGREQNVFE